MISLTVKNADTVGRKLAAAGRDLLTAQERGVRESTRLVERALKLELTHKGGQDAFWGKTGDPGEGLAVRTGQTRASVTGGGTSVRYGNRVVGIVGSPAAHLRQHEDGATVRGTSPKGFARIPTAAAQTGSGVDRNAGRSIRDIPGAFLLRSASGRLWAAVRTFGRVGRQVRGKEARAAFATAQGGHVGSSLGGLTLLYLLVRSYTLRPRAIFARVARQQSSPVAQIMREQVSLVVQKANA